MSSCHDTGSAAAPFAGQRLRVHTLPFAFRPPQEDDESVKISTMTPSRSSALSPALPAGRPCASADATRIVILLALSEFCAGSPAPLPHAGRSLPAAQAGISPAFFGALDPSNPQFLFDTNKPFPFTTYFSARSKQSTYFFLFNTNDRSQITAHRSPITKSRRIP